MKLITLLIGLLGDNGWPEHLGGYYVQDGDDGFVKWSKVKFTEKCNSAGYVWSIPQNWSGSGRTMPDFRDQPICEDWKTTVISRDMYIAATTKPVVESSCECETCHEGDDYKYLKSKLSEEDQAVLEKLYADLVHTRMDLNWHQAVLDGSWPNAEDHMLRAGWVRLK